MENINIDSRICNLVKDFGDNLYSLELLLLFGRRPYDKLNRTIIFSAFAERRFDTEIALQYLIEKRLVTIQMVNEKTLYALTEDENLRFPVLEMVNIDQSQWLLILQQILRVYEIA